MYFAVFIMLKPYRWSIRMSSHHRRSTVGNVPLPRPRVPHIWPGFGQMWEGTNARATAPIFPEDFQGEICEFPHLAKTGPDTRISCTLSWTESRVRLSLRKGALSSRNPTSFTGNSGVWGTLGRGN